MAEKFTKEQIFDELKKILVEELEINDGVMYPIAKMEMKFIKSANFGEELIVKCFLKEIEPAIVIKYEIYSGSEKIFKASTMQIGVNVKTGETLYEAPEKLRRAVYG